VQPLTWSSEQTPTPTDPTSLPGTEQPRQRVELYLPALRQSDANAASSAVEEDVQAQAAPDASSSTYLPTLQSGN
jgi:hypothetical protein